MNEVVWFAWQGKFTALGENMLMAAALHRAYTNGWVNGLTVQVFCDTPETNHE